MDHAHRNVCAEIAGASELIRSKWTAGMGCAEDGGMFAIFCPSGHGLGHTQARPEAMRIAFDSRLSGLISFGRVCELLLFVRRPPAALLRIRTADSV